jgi:alkanesulfonate monooxygenase SsuD/methylene tetrahydromethanopterin reductase-like flavin-dependent oxidoreductase (luciferase family)
MMLRDIGEQLKAADDMGFWGFGFTEHHFHIEGFEISNNPILLGLYFGMMTRNIRVGQFANVLPFHNPIRLAEDLAMLDQMMRGRSFVGFARGYQKRWADVLGQTYHVGATISDRSEMDQRNRERFEDHYRIIKKAWTSRTFSHHSQMWHIPPEGIHFPHEAVNKYGAGLDAEGYVREVGIAPLPYQKPHPKVFMPFSFSEDTFRFCAREDIVPIALSTSDEILGNLFRMYAEEAEKAGHHYRRGENVAVFRDCLVLEDRDEAHRWAAEGNGFVWPEWFAALGFDEAFRQPGETGQIKAGYDTLVERGFEFIGNPDDVNRQIERLVTRHNPEYLLMFQYGGGLIPHHVQMRHLETWATEIMPNWMD